LNELIFKQLTKIDIWLLLLLKSNLPAEFITTTKSKTKNKSQNSLQLTEQNKELRMKNFLNE
jgi:hypothetical protein